MDLIENGTFLLGISYKGKLYYQFSVKILTLGAECVALEMIEDLGLTRESTKSEEMMLVELAYLSQQLDIKGIPPEALTPQFLLDHLATDDYVLVRDHIATLRKKRQDAGVSLPPAVSR